MSANDSVAETKRRYISFKKAMRRSNYEFLRYVIAFHGFYQNGFGEVSVDASVDAATDILMERGLCASVLDWHKKPAGDELPW